MLESSEILGTRDELILGHMPQVKYIARRVSAVLPSHVDFNDMVSAGVLGLLDALEKFDPKRGVKFNTYAEIRIRGAILDSLRELDCASRSLRKQGRDLEKVSKDLEMRLGRPPTTEEICREMDLSLDDFYGLVSRIRGLDTCSLSELVDAEHDEDGSGRALTDHSIGLPSEQFSLCADNEARAIVARVIDGLPKRFRLVISMYYYDELTMKEIGRVLGVNESRISQIHSKAILLLQKRLGDFGKDYFRSEAEAHRAPGKCRETLSRVEAMIVCVQRELLQDRSDLAILKTALGVLLRLTNQP